MGLWTKEQLRAFIKENKLVSAQDAQNALKDLFAETSAIRQFHEHVAVILSRTAHEYVLDLHQRNWKFIRKDE